MKRSTFTLLFSMLSILALFVWGCPSGDDDDSAPGDDDDATQDDDDDSAGDDDDSAGDDDDSAGDDDDDSAGDDDDDSTPPQLTSSVEYSECLGGGQPTPTLGLQQDGDDLLIHLADWELNCCIELAVEAILDGDVVKVYVVDHGEPCECLCGFDVDVTVNGLPAGTYDVAVFFDGGAVASGTLEIT